MPEQDRSSGRGDIVQRTQYRFMWRGAHGDENGARWRDKCPTTSDLAEWREDLIEVWVEQRTVTYGPPSRVQDAALPGDDA